MGMKWNICNEASALVMQVAFETARATVVRDWFD